jgi:hypothetical protein
LNAFLLRPAWETGALFSLCIGPSEGSTSPYTYLEIGSYLGGSLQSHALDDRCGVIYSIDPRLAVSADDRAADYIQQYENNSTGRMLDLLRGIGGDTSKIRCFDMDAAEIDRGRSIRALTSRSSTGSIPEKAVISDFEFCRRVLRSDGVVLFHDFGIVYPAIMRICKSLAARRREARAAQA